LFDTTIERFLQAPFKEIDRIPDTMASFGKLLSGLAD